MGSGWFWPSSRGDDALISVRLGRMIHWISLACAAAVLAIGLYLTAASIYESFTVQSEQKDFDAAHANDKQWQVSFPNGNAVNVHAEEGASEEEVQAIANIYAAEHSWILSGSGMIWNAHQGGDRPMVPDIDFSPMLLALVAAIGALIGRGLRYLLAHE